MYVATPPLETLKWLLSLAASGHSKVGTKEEIKVSFVDARRAYFNAKCHENIFVELPHEDYQEGMCGKLEHWMYGTRGAASKWEDHYSNIMVNAGFVKGIATPCTFSHKDRDVRCVVHHGDDFTATGNDRQLDWFEKMLKDSFDVKLRGRLGSGPKDLQEIRILNRVARRTPDGFEWEADPRHAEIIIKEMGLTDATPVATPGLRDVQENRDETELEGLEATAYRALGARANFLSIERSDIQYAAKEICRRMSKPRVGDWHRLKRLGRYLLGKPRAIQCYNWQDLPENIDVALRQENPQAAASSCSATTASGPGAPHKQL